MSFSPPTVFFLAAGFGTRLRPLTEHVPKALVPVGNVPQLFRLAARYPASRRVANTHHLAGPLEQAVRRFTDETGLAIALSAEHDVLGTAGGLRAARHAFEPGPVLVHNADIEIPASATDVFAGADPEALATLLVGAERPAGAGNVGVDAAGRIMRLRAARTGAAEVASCDYLGVALVLPALLEALPEVGCLVGDVWIPALAAGRLLRVCTMKTPGFYDLGTPASYLAANLEWLHAQGLRIRAEPGAKLHPACNEVLAGARVVLSAPCERVVAWPGARCDRPLSDAIVTPHGTVEVTRQSGR